MSSKSDQNLPPEIQELLDLLECHKAALNRFIDLEHTKPQFVMFWFGSAIISLIRDEHYREHRDSEEAFAMLHHLYHNLYNLLHWIEATSTD